LGLEISTVFGEGFGVEILFRVDGGGEDALEF
jgi:hypothetical protein